MDGFEWLATCSVCFLSVFGMLCVLDGLRDGWIGDVHAKQKRIGLDWSVVSCRDGWISEGEERTSAEKEYND